MFQFKEIITYIFIIGAAQGVLLSFWLFGKKENPVANRMLAITILAYSLDILYALYTVTELYLTYPLFIGVSGLFPFIYSPALYLYIHIVSGGKKDFNLKYLYHFIPAGSMLVAGIFGVFIFGDEVKLSLMDPYSEKSVFIIVMRTIIPFYGITYLFMSLSELKKYHQRLKEKFSNIEKLKLNWLKYIIFGIAIVWMLEIIQVILIDIVEKPDNIAYNYIYAAVSILIYLITYKSLKQPEVFLFADEENTKGKQKAPIYKKSGLSEEAASESLSKLIKIMDEEKPYLKNDLTLPDLASSIHLSTHNLSEVINTKLNQNFYDLINKYRVEEVKRLIEKDEEIKFSILALGFEAGFSSKSAFYSAFKKVTGITPAQYRSDIRKI